MWTRDMWLNVIADRLTDSSKELKMRQDGIYPLHVVELTVEELLFNSMAPNSAYWCRGLDRLMTTAPVGDVSLLRAAEYHDNRALTSQSEPNF
jgi:hypothetical protein